MAGASQTRSSRKAQTPAATRIRELRARLGLSQGQLGLALKLDADVAVTRISQYERGVHAPIYSFVQRLAAFARVPEAYFYAQDDDLAELIAAFSKLEPAAKADLILAAKEAAKKGRSNT